MAKFTVHLTTISMRSDGPAVFSRRYDYITPFQCGHEWITTREQMLSLLNRWNMQNNIPPVEGDVLRRNYYVYQLVPS
jgi:hypothetical protein